MYILSVLLLILYSCTIYASAPNSISSSFENGYMVWESNSKSIRYWIDGRIMLDTWLIDNKQERNAFGSGISTRRSRFSLKSKIHNKFYGEFDFDLADNDPKVKDMWIAYSPSSTSLIKIGNHKVPFSLEGVTTSRWTSFMERATLNEFSPGRKLGLSYLNYSSSYFYHFGIFGDGPGEGAESSSEVDDIDPVTGKTYETSRSRKESLTFGGRFAIRPFELSNTIFHLGGSYYQQSLPKDGSVSQSLKFKIKPNIDGMNIAPLDTDKITSIKRIEGIGSEILLLSGGFMLQSEWVAVKLTSLSDATYNFSGVYFFTSYFLTDDKRTYSIADGELGPVSPRNKKTGALELALRFDYLNLNDRAAHLYGGRGIHLTVGVNWYMNDNVKIVLNCIYAHYDENATGPKKVYKNNDPSDNLKVDNLDGNDRLKIIALRFQYMF